MSRLRALVATAFFIQASPALAELTCVGLFGTGSVSQSVRPAGSSSVTPFGTSSVNHVDIKIMNQKRGELEPLLSELTTVASLGYWTQLTLESRNGVASPSESWKELSTMISHWGQTRRGVSFDPINEADLLYKGGEWKTQASSKKDGVLKIKVLKGQGSDARPQYWIMELDHGDDVSIGRRWLSRVVIEAEPRSRRLHLYTDNSNYYPATFSGRKAPRFEVTSIAFIRSVQEKFQTLSEESSVPFHVRPKARPKPSDGTQAGAQPSPKDVQSRSSDLPDQEKQARALIPSLNPGLTRVLELVENGHDPKIVVRQVFDSIQTLARAHVPYQAFGLNQTQALKLSQFIRAHAAKIDVGQTIQFYLSLLNLGYRFSPEELEAYEKRLDARFIEEMTVEDTRAFVEFAYRTYDPNADLWNSSTLSRLKSELVKKFKILNDDMKNRLSRMFFTTYDSLLNMTRGQKVVTHDARIISEFAANFIPHMKEKDLVPLLNVLEQQQILLSDLAERALEQNLVRWMTESKNEFPGINDLYHVAKLLSHPTPGFVDHCAAHLLKRLEAGDYWLYSRALHALWLMNPEKAFEFAGKLDSQKAIQASNNSFVTTLSDIHIHFKEVLKKQVPWLADWLKGKKEEKDTITTKSQKELFVLLGIIFPKATIELEKYLERADVSVDIYVENVENVENVVNGEAEKLIVEFVGPLHFYTDHLGRKRFANADLRRHELMRELGYQIVYVETEDLNALKRLEIEDVERVVKPGKKVKEIIEELLRR